MTNQEGGSYGLRFNRCVATTTITPFRREPTRSIPRIFRTDVPRTYEALRTNRERVALPLQCKPYSALSRVANAPSHRLYMSKSNNLIVQGRRRKMYPNLPRDADE